MRTSTIVWIIIVILVILGLGWWWYDSTQSTAQTPATTTTTTQTSTATLTLDVSSSPTLGSYLVADNGMTLYSYSKDSMGTSTCYGNCAAEWPPYTVSSPYDLTAGPAATGTVATITRADGTFQVTYNGIPLYFYASDVNPGDAMGQGVNSFSVATP